MILRSVIEHVKAQHWTAVALDFLIVVAGVFIGIQVSNFNEARAFRGRETELLTELRRELQSSIVITDQKSKGMAQVASAAKRSLEFIAGGASCGNECWPVLVDFLHASQFQPVLVSRSTYDEMRRLGLPRSRAIVDAVESYLAQNANIAATMLIPSYRSLVRQMIPVDAQEHYWNSCFLLSGGVETYALDCPKGADDDVAARIVARIVGNPDIEPTLTEWAGYIAATPQPLKDQNEAAERAIAAIDAELERRR